MIPVWYLPLLIGTRDRPAQDHDGELRLSATFGQARTKPCRRPHSSRRGMSAGSGRKKEGEALQAEIQIERLLYSHSAVPP